MTVFFLADSSSADILSESETREHHVKKIVICVHSTLVLKNYVQMDLGGQCSVSDPDQYVSGPLGSGSFHQQAKIEINQDFYCFVNSEWHVIFEDWSLCASCTARNKQKKLIFVGILKANAKKRRSRSRILIRNPVYGSKDPDLYENVTNPEHSDNVN